MTCLKRLSKLLSKMLSGDMSLERLANATVKNRVEYSQLSILLNRIEKEKQLEIRMLNTEKQRFKAKYFKANLNIIPSQASEVKMFETHTPGFCFRRNGEKRIPQTIPQTPSVDFDHLQFLLFTNGEVDIEKILCLHLLSSHETKHLTPPKRFGGSFTKKDSPLEQLIERSKEKLVSSPLPTYILDVNRQPVHRQIEEDERLTSRLIVNEKLTELIATVMTTLEHTNPEKVHDLITVAGDTGSLKRIFRKPHIQEFVMLLKDNSLVHSCSSFVLSQPEDSGPRRIEIRTSGGALEELVRFIRSNVLQFQARSSYGILEQESRSPVVIEDGPAKRNAEPRRLAASSRVKVARREPSRVEEIEVEINPFRRQVKNFIAKNIEAVANYKRVEEVEEAPPKRPRRDSTEVKRTSIPRERRPSQFSQSSRTPQPSDQVKVHSKQTTCPACMERWKIPRPAPKVSKVMKPAEPSVHSMERNSSDQLLKTATNVQQRISMLIHKETFKLAAYDRKYSNASNVSRAGAGGRRRSSNVSDSVDQMDLNVLDLERIRQEIRERETKKKLEKFLGD